MAEPDPTEVAPWYLRNITQALALDEATGNVYVRTDTTIDIGNANISVGNVGISSFGNIPITGNTLPVTVSGGNVNATVTGNVTSTLSGNLAGITGNVTVVDGGGSLTVDGTVNIGTMPNVNAEVSGNVAVTALGNIDVTGNTLPVSGNVNIGSLPEVEIKNDTGNPIPVSKDTNTNSVTNPIYVEGVNNASFFAPEQSDAFGRLRVSNPYTLFETQSRYYDHGQFSSSLTGTANVVYQANSSSYLCNVGTASGDSVLRETVRVFPYQPGKSLLVLQSFCFNTPKSNLRQRSGYFDADNGIFFEVNGTDLYMVIRSSTSGSIVEDRVLQANWNGDTLTGSGGVSNPSNIELDVALDQIWFCDVEWLGVGSVRVGFIIDGQYITCHTFHHANIPGNTTTYMTTGSLPLRCEITNTGTTASISTMRQICSTVISEGGFQLSGSGNPRAASHVIGSPVTLPNDVSFKPVIAIRLKSTMLDAIVVPMNYSLVPVQQSIFQYRIYKRAVTSGGTWVDSAVDSAVQYNLGPTALVSGDIVEQSFINSTNQSSSAPTQETFTFDYQLEREPFTNTPYEYVIMMATTGNGQTVYASIEWQEMT